MSNINFLLYLEFEEYIEPEARESQEADVTSIQFAIPKSPKITTQSPTLIGINGSPSLHFGARPGGIIRNNTPRKQKQASTTTKPHFVSKDPILPLRDIVSKSRGQNRKSVKANHTQQVVSSNGRPNRALLEFYRIFGDY